VADNIKTPSIYLPKTLSDLIVEKGRNPDAVLFAGGTFLMTRPTSNDIISILGVPELQKVTHTDRFLEIGSAITIEQLLNTGSYLLSKSTFNAIESIGTTVIRSRATVGGALCSRSMRFSLSCILATIGAQAEIRTIQRKGFRGKRIKSIQNWYSVRKLYSPSGDFMFGNNIVMTRVRIPARDDAVQIFRFLEAPMKNPSQAVYFGFEYTPNQNGISQPTLCVAYPETGFFFSQDFNSGLSSLSMPAEKKAVDEQCRILREKLSEACPEITEVQKARTIRLFTSVIQEISQQFMTLV
jgi:hypothetical protein